MKPELYPVHSPSPVLVGCVVGAREGASDGEFVGLPDGLLQHTHGINRLGTCPDIYASWELDQSDSSMLDKYSLCKIFVFIHAGGFVNANNC